MRRYVQDAASCTTSACSPAYFSRITRYRHQKKKAHTLPTETSMLTQPPVVSVVTGSVAEAKNKILDINDIMRIFPEWLAPGREPTSPNGADKAQEPCCANACQPCK